MILTLIGLGLSELTSTQHWGRKNFFVTTGSLTLDSEFVKTDKLGDPISSKINDLSPDPNIHDHTGFICVDGTLAV